MRTRTGAFFYAISILYTSTETTVLWYNCTSIVVNKKTNE